MSQFGPLIGPSELERRLGMPDLRIVDCRFDLLDPASGRRAWRSAAIPGAVYADLDNDLAGPITETSGRHPLPDAEVAAATFGTLGIGNDSHVVVYDDDSGGIAARAWWMLRWLGHERVALLDGGFARWMRENRSIEPGEVKFAPAALNASPRRDWLTTTDEIQEILRTGSEFVLVDARDAARFRGEVEPIDRVAGHIPGAVNLPFSRNLRAGSRWKTAGELRALWTGLLGEQGDRDWGVMCGSGVTACHLALSARLAGRREPRLYAGSWSEWIRDPERPVVTGP